MADVTLDALVAQNSITNPPLASDMQSLCGFSSSVGSLIGFSISGLLVHLMGAQGALGLLSIPSALVFSAGILLKESRATDFDYMQVHKKFDKAVQSMGATLKCPEVWRPCVYLYLSLSLSLEIQGGMFYWFTDRLTGPAFSELHAEKYVRENWPEGCAPRKSMKTVLKLPRLQNMVMQNVDHSAGKAHKFQVGRIRPDLLRAWAWLPVLSVVTIL